MKYVIKRLRRSDLTFFEYQYRIQNAGNQKSLNLTRRVFIDVLFPSAPEIAANNGEVGAPKPFHLPLTIYGPGERRIPQIVSRSVLPKTQKQKNWRLNGEFVRDPDEDPNRYHALAADDVGVLAFDGDAFPTAVTLVLLSQAEPGDLGLRTAVLEAINNKAMGVITRDLLARIIEREASPTHPIREVLDSTLDEVLEDAALGSSSAVRRLRNSGSARRMSAKALQNARRNAEVTGRNGELLLNDWLQAEVEAGHLRSAVWTAETNAISPWDFVVEENDGTRVRIEVKSTAGPFERNFHISQAEIEWAAEAEAPRTDLYRLSELQDGTASLRICRDIRAVAAQIVAATSGLGVGIVPDSYTISPVQFGTWSEAVAIEVPDEDDDEEDE
ncbi:hypothetical protein GOFOIKOB_6147 [Methylobacterium tardum]|uniref:Protein NO VEIN C-terminal domain-containing protein n=1 Tax=Methylobacterium tardum TaxID=374432 RepID=A0AA37WPZ2_9HYPH|nr:DUF3883 domain-containing protein [Methylobacterium tardum]URD38753.1 DUF3883 domain-containing protein [Methylobacterium tardum]GJE53071.1 hypothetical protein GOFOIKOB_6147 [Methylobacterium tardum]GLS68724.1 hypothetical protein GCM10007890_07360 [Methylobacterium tardum]